jgi:hypothetical protein
MCLSGLFPTPKPMVATAPAPPPAPSRADETSQAAVNQELNDIRRRKGSEATLLTGGLGDSSYGQNVQRKTALGS